MRITEHFKKKSGFTLIELIFVIAIIAIISVNVMPKWLASSTNLVVQQRKLLNDIRYTQALSVTSGQRYRWVLLSTSSYQITNEAGTPVILPSGETTVNLPSGTTISTSSLPNNLIAFDSQGTPYTDASYPGTALMTTANVTIVSGTVSRYITIYPLTGFGLPQ
jgi:prepilin-type N-terminal cleavage/methylation domain-containing protein